jgi:hypothetical protein
MQPSLDRLQSPVIRAKARGMSVVLESKQDRVLESKEDRDRGRSVVLVMR